MAIFSGKIIECYFSDIEHKTIEVIYKEGEKAIAHHINVNIEHPDYKDLIDEYGLENIQKNTSDRSKKYMEQAKISVENLGLELLKKETSNEIKNLINMFLQFDETNKDDGSFLFEIKLNLFETDIVKNSENQKIKTNIRQSKSPWDAINEARKLIAK